MLLLPLGLALGRPGRASRGVSLLGRNVREARVTLEGHPPLAPGTGTSTGV